MFKSLTVKYYCSDKNRQASQWKIFYMHNKICEYIFVYFITYMCMFIHTHINFIHN